MLEASIQGLVNLLNFESIIFIFLGVTFGLLIGFLPGLGGPVAMALVLPFVVGVPPAAAFALLLGAHIGTIYGSSITSILFNIPGASKSVSLCFDGYPMTQKGEGARALGASATAAFLGGIFGAIFLTISLPFMRALMLALGPAEYLMMAVWGLSVIATFSEGSVIKGLIAAGFGLLVSFMGMDPVTGTARYTFGSLFLMDGIEFPVAVIGLFAVSQMIKLYVKGGSIAKKPTSVDGAEIDSKLVWVGVKDCLIHWKLVLRSSFLGLWIGILPGIGASVGGIAAYAQAVQTSKNPETFGTGNVEGVIAPEATNAANEGGGLMPTLGFGIPGGEAMAILLSAFIVMGIQPGREMLTTHLDIVFTMVWIIILANSVITLFGLFTAHKLANLTMLPGNILIPIVLSICFTGAYAIQGRIGDVIVAFIFGVIGYIMDRYEYSRADMVIGMVLGLMLERYLHISLTLYGNLFIVTRPVALLLFLVVVYTLAYPFLRKRKMEKANAS